MVLICLSQLAPAQHPSSQEQASFATLKKGMKARTGPSIQTKPMSGEPMDIVKLVKWDDRISQSEAEVLLKRRRLQRLPIKKLVALPYDEIKDYLWCQSNTMMSYKTGETTALIWELGSKKKKRIKIHFNDGYYKLGPDGIPNGEKSNFLDSEAFCWWRFQNRDFSGLLVRYGGLGDRRGVVACYGPGDGRFGVLATRIGKRNEEKDVALDKLKAYAKKSKWAKEILRRLKGCE